MSEKKLFLVDTISVFRRKYVIEAESLVHAYDEITMRESKNELDYFEPVTERYLDETISDGREITKQDFDKMLETLKEDSSENCSHWLGDKLIRKINYDR